MLVYWAKISELSNIGLISKIMKSRAQELLAGYEVTTFIDWAETMDRSPVESHQMTMKILAIVKRGEMQNYGKFIQSYKKRAVSLCVYVSVRCKCCEEYEKMVALIHVFSTSCLLIAELEDR